MVDAVRLPTDVEEGAVGGPRNMTIVQAAVSGLEQRMGMWDIDRGEWDISYRIKTKADLLTVVTLFRACKGKLYSFLFKDWSDYQATNEAIGTGDGADATWQLIKTYNTGVRTYVRTIKRPVSGTLTVKVAGTTKTETTHYTVDYTTGIITFTGGNIPTGGQAITATFDFDIPVRFDTDHLRVNMQLADLGHIPSIPIVEVLE